jgi:hypothetical protein
VIWRADLNLLRIGDKQHIQTVSGCTVFMRVTKGYKTPKDKFTFCAIKGSWCGVVHVERFCLKNKSSKSITIGKCQVFCFFFFFDLWLHSVVCQYVIAMGHAGYGEKAAISTWAICRNKATVRHLAETLEKMQDTKALEWAADHRSMHRSSISRWVYASLSRLHMRR